MLRLRTLGGVALERNGRRLAGAAGQRKPLALLALLAAADESGLSRDKVLAYLWPESPADRAAHSLRQLLHSLRRDLEEDSLFLVSGDLVLNPRVISSDVAEFNRALGSGDLERAISLYGGPFLEGFHSGDSLEFEQWIELERERLAKRFCGALQSLAVAAGERGDHVEAVEWWRRLAEADPFNSRVAVGFMEALSAAGDRAGALQAARTHQERLHKELDAEPDPTVEETAQRIRHPSAQAWGASAPAAADEPSASVRIRPDVLRSIPPPASVAVLPFVNMSGDPEDEYFSDGMTDELRSALCRLPGLRVAARTSAYAFKNRSVDVRRIGEQLNVGAVVEGSVRKTGDRVRIAAQLSSAADGFQLWADTYERTLDDVFAVQDEISRAIAAGLSPKLAAQAGRALVAHGTERLEAYTRYLQGRFRLNKRALEDLHAAVALFEDAIRIDPEYALAYAGLAEAHAMLGFEFYGDTAPREALPKARAAIRQALALNPELADAHGWLGVIFFVYEWDWPAAEEAFTDALELDARSPFVHVWHSLFLGAMNRLGESLRAAVRAQALDPLSIVAALNVGRSHFWAGRYDEALRHVRGALDMDPRDSRAWHLLSWTLCAAGRPEEARLEAERALELLGPTTWLLSIYGYACAVCGKQDEALAILEQLRIERAKRYVSPLWEVQVLIGLGDLEGVFRAHERGLAERAGYLPFVGVNALYDPIRSDPRFVSLLERLRLPAALAVGG